MGTRVISSLFLGGAGGFFAWLLTDFIFNPVGDPQHMAHAGLTLNFVYGGFLGLILGIALGIADGATIGSRARFTRAVLRGGLAGLLGGSIGLNVGNQVFSAVGGKTNTYGLNFPEFLTQCLIRSIGWLVFGGVLGGLYGLLDAGARKGRNGLIGGGVGGFVGGLLFLPLVFAVPRIFALGLADQSDRIARLVSFAALGALIGFFTALAKELLKTAWVFVVYGRNEGKEIVLDRPVNRIGRQELAEIPIFRDKLIAANHAELRLQGDRFWLVDGGSAVGSAVNGQRITQPTVLKDSDLIQVGNTQVIFYERATAGPVRRQVDLTHAAPAAPSLAPAGSCQFCGQPKDPATGACACSAVVVPASAAPGAPLEPFGPSTVGPGLAPMPGTSGDSAAPGLGALAAPRLTCLSGAHAGEVFQLNGGLITVGRDAGNQIALVRDSTVSRQHATIGLTASGLTITDVGSSNGTFVNGARITVSPAHPGDEVMFGTARFRLDA